MCVLVELVVNVVVVDVVRGTVDVVVVVLVVVVVVFVVVLVFVVVVVVAVVEELAVVELVEVVVSEDVVIIVDVESGIAFGSLQSEKSTPDTPPHGCLASTHDAAQQSPPSQSHSGLLSDGSQKPSPRTARLFGESSGHAGMVVKASSRQLYPFDPQGNGPDTL